MKKSSFEGFITRYNLGGEVESVKIDSAEEGLSVKFISDDKTLLGNVSSDNKDFPNGEYGVYTTSQLKGLLSVLDSDINVKEGDASLVFSDKGTSVNYMLADLSVIPVVPDLKQLPEFTSTIKMDNDFVNKFVKSKGALSDSDTFTFSCKSSKGEVILGYSKINSNRISINVECVCDGDVEPISFSAKYLKEILNANKGAKSSSLKISPNGLAHVSFENDGFKSNYYLVEIK
jgi:DNA polymerase III sliding clamp (beta) subunit (PCNA family)